MCEKGAGHPLSNWQSEKEGSKDAHTRTSVNAIEKGPCIYIARDMYLIGISNFHSFIFVCACRVRVFYIYFRIFT